MIEHVLTQDDHVLDRFKDSQEILGEKKHHDIPFADSWLCIIDTKRLHYLDFSLATPPLFGPFQHLFASLEVSPVEDMLQRNWNENDDIQGNNNEEVP